MYYMVTNRELVAGTLTSRIGDDTYWTSDGSGSLDQLASSASATKDWQAATGEERVGGQRARQRLVAWMLGLIDPSVGKVHSSYFKPTESTCGELMRLVLRGYDRTVIAAWLRGPV